MGFNGSEILQEVWRTGLLYVLAFVVFRLMGKRSISHLAPFDIAVVIIIGEAVAIGIEELDKSVLIPVVSILMLGLLQFVLTFVNMKWRTAEKVSQGVGRILVTDGAVQQQNMDREHMSRADLMIALREQAYERLSDIKTVRLEPTGHISVLPAAHAQPVVAGMLGLSQGETLVAYLDRRFQELRRQGEG